MLRLCFIWAHPSPFQPLLQILALMFLDELGGLVEVTEADHATGGIVGEFVGSYFLKSHREVMHALPVTSLIMCNSAHALVFHR